MRNLIYIFIFISLCFISGCAISEASDDEIVVKSLDANDLLIPMIESSFRNASVISIRYLSKRRAYPSDRLELDLDKFWNYEVKSNCIGSCLDSEKWLYSFFKQALSTSHCPLMLSTYVEFTVPDGTDVRIYIDHAGHCLYVPSFKKYYFSKIRFNEVIRDSWGDDLRGM